MFEMSHIRVETWRTARQVVGYRWVALRRLLRQNPEHFIRRAAFTLGIRETLREIGSAKIEEILFSLEDSAFFDSRCHL